MTADDLWANTKPNSAGLVPCVVQDEQSRAVLMLAWVSKESLEQSLASGYATFYSRSRNELWEKGATSGNRQRIVEIRIDCDQDTLLFVVSPMGPACHEGEDTCFSYKLADGRWERSPQKVLPSKPQ